MSELTVYALIAAQIVGMFVFFVTEQHRRARIWAAEYVWCRERARACRKQAMLVASRNSDSEENPKLFKDILNAFVVQEDEAADRADALANNAINKIPYRLREKFISEAKNSSEIFGVKSENR